MNEETPQQFLNNFIGRYIKMRIQSEVAGEQTVEGILEKVDTVSFNINGQLYPFAIWNKIVRFSTTDFAYDFARDDEE